MYSHLAESPPFITHMIFYVFPLQEIFPEEMNGLMDQISELVTSHVVFVSL